MIVVLTGGTGYVGRYVAARCLANGWRVHLLTRSASKIPVMIEGLVVRHDTDGSIAALTRVLGQVRPDCVLHLASGSALAHGAEQVDQLIDANIRFPTRLLEAMRAAGVNRFVNTGTFWQHYAGSTYWPVDFYAATKQAFEDLLRHYTDGHGFAAITLKLYDNYGPDDPRRKIVTGLVEAARLGKTIEMSAGEQILDLTHVEDLAAAFAIAAELACTASASSDRCFFVSGERVRLKELVGMIVERNRGLRAHLGARAYRDREIMDPIFPGESLPGWQRAHSLAVTIDDMLSDG